MLRTILFHWFSVRKPLFCFFRTYVRGSWCLFFRLTSTGPRHTPARQQTTCTEQTVATLPPIRRACVTHPFTLYCCAAAYRSLRPVIHHLHVFSLLLCERSTHTTVDESVWTIWIKWPRLCPCSRRVGVMVIAQSTLQKSRRQTAC